MAHTRTYTDPTTTPEPTTHTTCFTPESLVLLSNNTYVMIKDLKIGDEVVSFNINGLSKYDNLNIWNINEFNGVKSNSLITEINEHYIETGYYSINDGLLNVTNEHYVFIKRNDEYKFSSVNKIEIVDYLYNYND